MTIPIYTQNYKKKSSYRALRRKNLRAFTDVFRKVSCPDQCYSRNRSASLPPQTTVSPMPSISPPVCPRPVPLSLLAALMEPARPFHSSHPQRMPLPTSTTETVPSSMPQILAHLYHTAVPCRGLGEYRCRECRECRERREAERQRGKRASAPLCLSAVESLPHPPIPHPADTKRIAAFCGRMRRLLSRVVNYLICELWPVLPL